MERIEFSSEIIRVEAELQISAHAKTLPIYWEHVKEWTIEEFREAIDRTIRSKPEWFRFPPIHEIENNRPPRRPTPEEVSWPFDHAFDPDSDPNDELAEREGGPPEDIFRAPRYRCLNCQDSGVRTVFHPICYEPARRGSLKPSQIRTCAVACRCEAGGRFSNQPKKPLPVFNAATMLELDECERNPEKQRDALVEWSSDLSRFEWTP